MGVNDAHNTVGKMSTPTTLFGLCCAREVAEYNFYKCIGYGLWYRGLTCAPCLAFSVRPLVLSGRTSLVGRSQSALFAPIGEER